MINALIIVTGALVRRSGSSSPVRWSAAYAGDYALMPGKLELTTRLTRVMLPFLTLAAIAAA